MKAILRWSFERWNCRRALNLDSPGHLSVGKDSQIAERHFEKSAKGEPDLWGAEHQRRVLAALTEVAEGPLPALVVCHGGTIRCAVAARHPRGLDAYQELDVPNASIVRLDGLPSPAR